MVKMIEVRRKYGPQIVYGSIMEIEEVVAYLTRGTGLTPGQIFNVAYEIEAVKVHAATAGRSLRLPPNDLYRPVMAHDGTIHLNLVPNKDLISQINSQFHGKVKYAANIGKSNQEMADFWNARHPDNPIDLK